MKPDNLFTLIKSLNKNEKGYFKKNSRLYSTTKENHYLLLFDAMDRMSHYDEKELKVMLKGEKWIKNLPALKAYLFLQLLKNLDAYQNTFGKDENTVLRYSEILQQRGLYASAFEMLRRGQAIAEENENYSQMLTSLAREISIVKQLHAGTTGVTAMIQRVKLRRNEVLTLIQDLFYIEDFRDEVYALYDKTGTVRLEEHLKYLDSMADDTLVQKIERSPYKKQKALGYNALTAYYFLKQDKVKSFVYAQKMFHLYDKDGAYSQSLGPAYPTYFNYLQMCITSRNFKEFEKNIKYLENLPTGHGFSKPYKFFVLHFLYFAYLRATGRHSGLYSYLPAFERDMKTYAPQLSRTDEMGLAVHLAYLLFLNGEVEQAIDWNNRALALEKEVHREDYRVGVRIQDIILHYEAESFRLLDSKLLSAQRYLRKNSLFYRVEHCIITHLRQLSKTADKKVKAEIFRRFGQKFDDIYELYPTERNFDDYFDIKAWINKKIKQLSR